MKHTKEPWVRNKHEIMGRIGDPGVARVCLTEINYARAELCVNACTGIEDPADWIGKLQTLAVCVKADMLESTYITRNNLRSALSALDGGE